jgi:hypothetical protein
MGLDMYLERETYFSDFKGFGEHRDALKLSCPHITRKNVKKVIEEAGYWRKDNHIHKWFVDNVQDGVDQCQRSEVSRDQLKALKELCEKSLKDKNAELLPPIEGFFFGGTDVDEWYWRGTEHTIEVIETILKIPEQEDKASYYYRSSW